MKTEFSATNSLACIVTGASSGIGRAIADMLFARGYKVFGIGRNFEFEPSWEKIVLDLNDTNLMVSTIEKIFKENKVFILVNSAGVAFYGPHETISYDDIKLMTRTNIEVPMILSSMFLKYSKKEKNGYIFNISSVTSENSNTYGAAYGATKAALSSFSRSIFDESRKQNIKIIEILPDMTATNLYRNASFNVDEDLSAHLLPEDVSSAVSQILDMRDGAVVTKIKLQPQIHKIKKREN